MIGAIAIGTSISLAIATAMGMAIAIVLICSRYSFIHDYSYGYGYEGGIAPLQLHASMQGVLEPVIASVIVRSVIHDSISSFSDQ